MRKGVKCVNFLRILYTEKNFRKSQEFKTMSEIW